MKITPERELTPQPAAVAHRRVVVPGENTQGTASGRIPAQTALTSKLNGIGGAKVTGVVLDAATGRLLYDRGSARPAVPASTTKIITSTAAMAALGPDKRLTTKVVRKGDRIVLVGGGDPTLSSKAPTAGYPRPASLSDLAKKTAVALKAAGVRKVAVDYDSSLYQGSPLGPGWKPNYVPEGSVAPVAALMVDNGRISPNPCEGTIPAVADGPSAAAVAFGKWLKVYGITPVKGRAASGGGGTPLADVQSPTVAALVEHLMQCSDNDVAESMIRQVAIAKGQPATFEGGARAVRQVLQSLGVAEGVNTVDGSGLSPRDRITPLALARIVALDASGKTPALRTVISGMPVAGFSGTLTERFTGTGGAGIVRAKTGTLSKVATLAGIVTDADGRLLTFAFMDNDAVDLGASRTILDTLASTVVSCGC
ncbi:D-alanyl-D-alanine carboxypeptidase/D-alanyl-D-alanine endopeptidase [Actinocorallia lasiicapitis]